MFNPEHVKAEMKAKGWSYRSASERIGKSYQWICQVLNGQAKSRPVLRAISALPRRKKIKRASAGAN